MQDREKLGLFKAALALAVADGELASSEMGVVQGLAVKVGVGQASFDAMVAAARRGEQLADSVVIDSPADARTAMLLLVAQARIDGQITDPERELLVRIAGRLQIPTDEFQAIYIEGIRRADEIRARRSPS